MRYSLRQLEVFLAVARAESVSQAGAVLHMSQSAVSGSLAELERQFGIHLFDRVGKRLHISERGKTVRAQAEATLAQALDLERSFASSKGLGRLRVGATLTVGNYVAGPLVARFLAAFPMTDVSLRIANTAAVAQEVANFSIDVGLVEGELAHPDLNVMPWRDDELVVFCGLGHPLAQKRSLSDEDLRRAAWIVREEGSGTRQTFDRAMHGLLHDLRIVLSVEHTEVIKSTVAAGLGLGCVSRLALVDEFKLGRSKPCRVPQRDFRRQFFFLLHKRMSRSSAVDAWLAVCEGAR